LPPLTLSGNKATADILAAAADQNRLTFLNNQKLKTNH
jgi:hypothetical protein